VPSHEPDDGTTKGVIGMAHDGRVAAVVTTLRRPPVRQSVLVRSDRQHTFDTFVATIGVWWPVTPFSAGQDRVRERVTEEQLARDCALPGGYTGGAYREGWARILGRLAAAAGGQA
jgi:hypothetical protein